MFFKKKLSICYESLELKTTLLPIHHVMKKCIGFVQTLYVLSYLSTRWMQQVDRRFGRYMNYLK
jgi:hypothetical protein